MNFTRSFILLLFLLLFVIGFRGVVQRESHEFGDQVLLAPLFTQTIFDTFVLEIFLAEAVQFRWIKINLHFFLVIGFVLFFLLLLGVGWLWSTLGRIKRGELD